MRDRVVPGDGRGMPTTLPTGEAEGGFETRHYAPNLRCSQNELVLHHLTRRDLITKIEASKTKPSNLGVRNFDWGIQKRVSHGLLQTVTG